MITQYERSHHVFALDPRRVCTARAAPQGVGAGENVT